MWEFFSSDSFMPHGHCYLWKPGLVRLHLATDALIALAYVSIPFTLVRLVRQRRDVPFRWLFVWFGLFIVSCGATHVYEVWNLYHADYWAAGLVKAFTAFASVATAVLLARSMPEVMALPTPTALRDANEALRRSQEELEQRVAERTAELSRLNATLRFQAQLLGSVQNVVVAFDTEGRITHWNRQAEESLGWMGDEVRGRPVLETLVSAGGAEAEVEAIRQSLAAGMPWTGELAVRRKDGQSLPAWVTQSPVRGEAQALAGAVLVVVDISER